MYGSGSWSAMSRVSTVNASRSRIAPEEIERMRTHQPVNNHDDLLRVVDGLLEELGLDRRDTGGEVTFAGLDPLRPTVLKTGAASAAIASAGAIASAILWRMRGGEAQDIHVDLRKAYTYQSP